MLKKDWSKIVKKAISSKGADPLKMEMTPYRDWRIVVMIFFVGLVASFGFNIYMSIEINSDKFFTTSSKNEGEATLNRDGLTKVLAELSDKEALFEKARTKSVPMVDPSL